MRCQREEEMDWTNDVEALDTVVVTGAKGSLGGTVCQGFLQAGVDVVGVDIAVEESGLFADSETDGLYWRHLDATSPSDVGACVSEIESEVGPIDALVNCAGGFRWAKANQVTDEDIDFLMGANLKSALLLVREVLSGMKERDFGRIVLISSKSTLQPGTGEGAYAATKSGLNALTKSVADEVRQSNVNINAVLPSVIDTPANREEMSDQDFSRWVKREQLAEIIFRLTQPFGDPINGALLPVTGRM